MKLHFKKPSKEARIAMSEAAKNIDYAVNRGFEQIQLAQDQISDITNHEHAKVVNNGNSAILAAMSIFNDKIMIPDQGGWTGFKNTAEFLGLKTIEIPTELGIITRDTLEESINKHRPEALFVTSFAGYFAEQSIKEIYEVCENKNVILVEDASGGIGDPLKRLANGAHAHIIVASTGSPKIVNVGTGGFISTNDNEIFRKSKYILKTLKANPVTCAGIAEEIKNAPEILSKTVQACDKIKKQFEYAAYPDKRGISVVLMVDNPKKIGYELRKKLSVEGRSIITTCPRYERVIIDAICIEIKNLDPLCLENEIINEITQIINGVIE